MKGLGWASPGGERVEIVVVCAAFLVGSGPAAGYTCGMSLAGFDTLRAARELQEAGIERGHAEAIAHVVGLRSEDHASKRDLSALEARLTAKIETVAARIETVAAELDTRVERGKNVLLRSILASSFAIIVTLVGGILAILSAG